MWALVAPAWSVDGHRNLWIYSLLGVPAAIRAPDPHPQRAENESREKDANGQLAM